MDGSGSGSGGDGRSSGSGGNERRDSAEPFPALSETITVRRDSTDPFPALSETISAAPAGGVFGLEGKGDAGTRGADTPGGGVGDAGKILGVDEGKEAPVSLIYFDCLRGFSCFLQTVVYLFFLVFIYFDTRYIFMSCAIANLPQNSCPYVCI